MIKTHSTFLIEIKAKLRIHVEAQYPCMVLSFTLLIRARLSSQMEELKRFTLKVRQLFFCVENFSNSYFLSTASNEVERQSWVTALELAKAKAIRAIESEEEEEDNSSHAIPSEEINSVARDLSLK